MKTFLVPLGVYSALAALYLAASGGPARVHILSLSVLVLAILVPAIWAAHLGSLKARSILCGAFALAAMLAWDLSAHLLIAKAEPLSILRGVPLAYALGLIVLSSISLVAAYLGAPPNKSSKPTPLRGAA